MSWSSLVDPATKKFYPSLVPEGGGVNLQKGQLITANAQNVETALPVGANGTILMADSNQALGLRYAVVPGAVALAKAELISADAAGTATIVTAPAFPAQEGWVLTATAGAPDGTGLEWKNGGQTPFTAAGQMQYGGAGPGFADTPLNLGTNGQILKAGATAPVWVDVGGGGVVSATLPLVENAVGNASQVSINFAAGAAGQIPYGNGTALTGALTNTPAAGQILGIAGNPAVPTWIDAGGTGVVTALAPLTEYAVGAASNVAIDFTAKGDLVVGAGAQVGGNPVAGVVLPVGTNNFVLTANSATGSGLEWRAGAGPVAQTNFFELEFPGSPPFVNTGNVVTLPSPSTIGTFTKNELITIMNYENQGAPSGNTFTFNEPNFATFRGGISGLNTGAPGENFFYWASFESTAQLIIRRTPLPLTADSVVGTSLGLVGFSGGDVTAKVNGFLRTPNYIYVYGFFDTYTADGVINPGPGISNVGNVIKIAVATGVVTALATTSGLSGLYSPTPNTQIFCAVTCPTTDKANGSYASDPRSVVFGGSFTTTLNSTLGCQYIAFYQEGGDTFTNLSNSGAAITSPSQFESAEGEGQYAVSTLLFHPDNNGLIVICNFTNGVWNTQPLVNVPMRNGVVFYSHIPGAADATGLGTNGQISNGKNIEYASGLVRKTSDNSLWLLIGYTDNAPTQNCWWYNLAGVGTGDAFVSPTGNATPPLQVSSGGCDIPENLLYAYGTLREPNGASAVTWFNPPLVAATYPDGGTYVWEDNQGTADTYIGIFVATTTYLQYTGLNNGAKAWSAEPSYYYAVSYNQSLLPALALVSLGPYEEGSKRGFQREITDQFLGVLAFAGNGLQYVASPTATTASITKQIIFKTQYSSVQMVVDTTANIYRVVNSYGNIEYT
jgi:hypothetical protein